MRTLNGLLRRLGLGLAGVALMWTPAWSIDYYLQAEQFLKTMPDGSSVAMWGYAQYADQTFTTPVKAASVPGPVLDVPAGDTTGLTIYLKNNLPALTSVPVETSLVIPGKLEAGMTPTLFPPDALGRQRMKSFTHETARGSVGTYSWPTLKPGTYLYHSGTHAQVHVQMGLYGVVTRDATTAPREAYPGRAYDSQVTLLFSEVDPALHQAISNGTYGVPSPPGTPNPNPTSTMNYVPKYFLVNGDPYSATSVPLSAAQQAGQRVLLRLVNAGLETHVPTLLGGHFTIIAEDGNPLVYTAERYGMPLAAGKTMDAIWVPTIIGTYPVYDRRLRQGMLAQLAVTGNGPPTITSTAITSATVGVPYSYQVVATDPNAGDTLTYSLTAPVPAGMTISATGLIAWTPTVAGPQAVTVRVQDQGGLSTTQSFTVTVNGPPVITSTAVTTATVGVAYSYDVNATDPNAGDVLTYSLTTAPTGMTISATGLVSWTPTATQTGPQAVTVRVQDQVGLFTTQSFTVIVAAPSGPAVISITLRNATAAGDPILAQPLVNGATLNLATLCNNCQVNFQAITSPATITGGSVRLALSGATAAARNDNTNPYTLPGDRLGNFAGIRLNPGAHTITATPYSGTNATGTPGTPLTITFTIGAANAAPTITSTAPLTATVGTIYSYQVTATDPNAGDTLTYSLTTAPTGMTINATTHVISWTPTAAQVGPQAVTVRVQDQGGLFATQSFSVTVAGTPPPLPAGLVAAYALNEGAGATTADASGNGHTGTLLNGPTWTAGQYGNAVNLDGVNDYITTTYTANLTTWTVEAWVRSPAAPANASSSGPVHREKNYQLNWNHPDPAFRGAAALSVGGVWYAASFGALQANTWYHLAATYDGQNLRAYKNGVLVTDNAAPAGAPDSEAVALNLGRDASGTGGVFGGVVDEVRIYDRVLTAAEIQADSAAPLP